MAGKLDSLLSSSFVDIQIKFQQESNVWGPIVQFQNFTWSVAKDF